LTPKEEIVYYSEILSEELRRVGREDEIDEPIARIFSAILTQS